MRICPKCKEFYGLSSYEYCRKCGTRTVDTVSLEGKKLVKEIKNMEKLK